MVVSGVGDNCPWRKAGEEKRGHLLEHRERQGLWKVPFQNAVKLEHRKAKQNIAINRIQPIDANLSLLEKIHFTHYQVLPDSGFIPAPPRAQWLKFVPHGLTTAGASSGHEAVASPGCPASADIAPAKMDALVPACLVASGGKRCEVYSVWFCWGCSTSGFLVVLDTEAWSQMAVPVGHI